MSSERFHLTSRWRVRAPAPSVFAVLVDLGSLSTWWPGVRSAPLGSSQEVVGRRAELEIFGLLPIALRAEVEITAAEPSRNVEVVSRGELQGAGEWRLRELSGVTTATFTWDVRLDRPGLRTLVRWLRPLLVLSHRFAMWRGERGLRRLLERGAVDMLTRASEASNFAPDTNIFALIRTPRRKWTARGKRVRDRR